MSNYIYYVKIGTGNSQSGYPEQPQNSCESLPIAVHPNCHLSRWLPLSSHSCLLLAMQSLTQVYAVPYTAICRHTVAYFSTFIFVVSQQITQSLTPAHALTNAIALELQQLHLIY